MEKITLNIKTVQSIYQAANKLDKDGSGYLTREEYESGDIPLPKDLLATNVDGYKVVSYIYNSYPQLNGQTDQLTVPIYEKSDQLLAKKTKDFTRGENSLIRHLGVYTLGPDYVRFAACRNIIIERLKTSEIMLGAGRSNDAAKMFSQALTNLEYLKTNAPFSVYYLEAMLAFAEAYYRQGDYNKTADYLASCEKLLKDNKNFFEPLSRISPLDKQALAGYWARINVLMAEMSITDPSRSRETINYLNRTKNNLEEKFDFYLWLRYKLVQWEASTDDPCPQLEQIFGDKATLLQNLQRNDPSYFDKIAANAKSLYIIALGEFRQASTWNIGKAIFASPSIDTDVVIKAALLLAEYYKNKGELDAAKQICNGVITSQGIQNKPYHLGKAMFIKGEIIELQGDPNSGQQLIAEALLVRGGDMAMVSQDVYSLGAVTYDGRLALDPQLVKANYSTAELESALTKQEMDTPLAAFLQNKKEYANNLLILFSVYSKQAIETGNRATMNRAWKLGNQLQAQLAKLDPPPSVYNSAVFNLIQAELAYQVGEDQDTFRHGIELAKTSIINIQALPIADYFAISEALIIIGNLQERLGDFKEALAAFQAITPQGINYKQIGLSIKISHKRIVGLLSISQTRGYLKAAQAKESAKSMLQFLVPLAELRAASVYLGLGQNESAKAQLAIARPLLATAEKRSDFLLTTAALLSAMVVARDSQASLAQLKSARQALDSESRAIEPASYLAAQVSAAKAELYLASAFKSRGAERNAAFSAAKDVLRDIPPGFSFLTIQAELKQANLGLSVSYREAFGQADIDSLLGLVSNARQIFAKANIKEGDFVWMDTANLEANLLIMRNRAGDADRAINLATSSLAMIENSSLAKEQKTYFRLYAQLRKAEALLQKRGNNFTETKLLKEATYLLKTIEANVAPLLPSYTSANLRTMPAAITGDKPSETREVLRAASIVLQDHGQKTLANKLDQAIKAVNAGQYTQAKTVVQSTIAQIDAQNVPAANLPGLDIIPFKAELYHQLTIVYSITERTTEGILTYEYGNSACWEAKLTSPDSQYYHVTLVELVAKMLRLDKDVCGEPEPMNK